MRTNPITLPCSLARAGNNDDNNLQIKVDCPGDLGCGCCVGRKSFLTSTVVDKEVVEGFPYVEDEYLFLVRAQTNDLHVIVRVWTMFVWFLDLGNIPRPTKESA